jgi:hypothetical protein
LLARIGILLNIGALLVLFIRQQTSVTNHGKSQTNRFRPFG